MKPPDFKHPSAQSLVQVVKAERGNSEISCINNQDSKDFLKAIPMGHAAESRSSAFTFAHVAVYTNESASKASFEVPDEMKRTIDSHLCLANMEASARRLVLKPEIPSHPNPGRLDSHDKGSWLIIKLTRRLRWEQPARTSTSLGC